MTDLMLQTAMIGLAAWRISSLLVDEAGPFNIFVKFRELFGIQHDENGTPNLWPSGYIAQMLSCILCTSLMVSIVLFGCLVLLQKDIWYLTPFAAGAIAMWMNGRTK